MTIEQIVESTFPMCVACTNIKRLPPEKTVCGKRRHELTAKLLTLVQRAAAEVRAIQTDAHAIRDQAARDALTAVQMSSTTTLAAKAIVKLFKLDEVRPF